jgi:hypothetical protein
MKRFFIVVLLFFVVAGAGAWTGWRFRIPNGDEFGCYSCHYIPPNQFYYDFRDVGGNQWNASLAAMDSDGDGYTNGEELLDPDGEWTMGEPDPGNPDDATNPNDSDENPSPAESFSFGEIKATFK